MSRKLKEDVLFLRLAVLSIFSVVVVVVNKLHS